MSHTKRIGILTSGGDCPGLNAVIRAVIKCANRKNWLVFGIPYGTDGFIDIFEGKYKPEDLILKSHGYNIPGFLQGLDVLQFLSGSILGSLNKGEGYSHEIMHKILAGYKMLNIEALIVVGGDGSLDIIHDLAKQGDWPLIAIPKTIDNDVPFTELSVGFDTAVDTVTTALYNLTFTAASHKRVMVVQIMGRDAGHLTINAGIAGGADIILIPELTPVLTEEVMEKICYKLADLRAEKQRFALIVVAEGVRTLEEKKDSNIGEYLAKKITECGDRLFDSGDEKFAILQDLDTRTTILGYIQRSGIPSSADRLLATAFGIVAVDLIAEGNYNRLVVWQNGRVQHESLFDVIKAIKESHKKGVCPAPVDIRGDMVNTARSLGIYLGE